MPQLTEVGKVNTFREIFGDQPELHAPTEAWQNEFTLHFIDPNRKYAQFREKWSEGDGHIVDYALINDPRDRTDRPIRRERFYMTKEAITGKNAKGEEIVREVPILEEANISYQSGITWVNWETVTVDFMKLEYQVSKDGPAIARFRYTNGSSTPTNIELALGSWEDIVEENPLKMGGSDSNKISINQIKDSRVFVVWDGRELFGDRLGELNVRTGDKTVYREDFRHPKLPFGLEIALLKDWNVRMFGVLPGKSWLFTAPRIDYPSLNEVVRGSDQLLRELPHNFDAKMVTLDYV